MKKPKGRGPKDQGPELKFSLLQNLMPWEQVAKEMTRRLGKPISRGRCQQLADDAERKIREALGVDAA